MANISIYLILAVFVIATVKATNLEDEKKYLQQCALTMGPVCGRSVIGKLYGHNNTIISKDCCYKLIQTGYSCHTKMTVFALQSNPNSTKVDWIPTLIKSDRIFDKCDQVTKPESSKFMAKCIEKIGSQCGEELYDNLTHDKNVTKPCCQKLVKMGKKCHISFTKALIRFPEMRNANATEVLKESKNVFYKCQHI